MVDRTDAAAPEPVVLLDVRDSVATVTLHRPERRNAISWQLMMELIETLERVRVDPTVRVVVLTGSGRDFCVGADLVRMGSEHARDHENRTLRGRSLDDDRQRLERASFAAELLVTYPKPTIAKVNGACAGAGLSLALAADFSVAAAHAMINTAFLSVGVSGDLGSAWLLTRAVGAARARALLLDPAKLTAGEAAALGIVTEVSADVDTRVAELAGKLSRQAPLAMTYAKENLLDAWTHGISDYLRVEVPRMVDSARTDDARIAARNLAQKRGPVRGD